MLNKRRSLRMGFTLVELLVVIAIIAVLIGMLLPTLNKARTSAQAISCLSNLRQVGMQINMYVLDNKQTYPPVRDMVNVGTADNMYGWYWPYYVLRRTTNQNTRVFRCTRLPDFSDMPNEGWSGIGAYQTIGMNSEFQRPSVWPSTLRGFIRATQIRQPVVLLADSWIKDEITAGQAAAGVSSEWGLSCVDASPSVGSNWMYSYGNGTKPKATHGSRTNVLMTDISGRSLPPQELKDGWPAMWRWENWP